MTLADRLTANPPTGLLRLSGKTLNVEVVKFYDFGLAYRVVGEREMRITPFDDIEEFVLRKVNFE